MGSSTHDAALLHAFVGALPPAARRVLGALPDLEAVLAALHQQGTSRFPAINTVQPQRFAAYIAERIPAEGDIERALRTICAADLFLCCACVDGNALAIELFRDEYANLIEQAVRKLRVGPTMAEEVLQLLLMQLLVGDDQQGRPLIANYGGYGRLSRWLRVVATRAAGRLLEKDKKLKLMGDGLIATELETQLSGDELALAKPAYRQIFKRAFKEAMRSLAPRDATLLRHRFVDGLNLMQIGAIYRVHHTTIHRRLERIKAEIITATEGMMRDELAVGETECKSIIRMINSDLDLTLRTFLGAHEKEPDGHGDQGSA